MIAACGASKRLDLASLPKRFSEAIVWPLTIKRAVKVSAVVGTILVAINQGDLILNGFAPPLWKIVLTYLVPFSVSSYSTASLLVGVAAAPRVVRRVRRRARGLRNHRFVGVGCARVGRDGDGALAGVWKTRTRLRIRIANAKRDHRAAAALACGTALV